MFSSAPESGRLGLNAVMIGVWEVQVSPESLNPECRTTLRTPVNPEHSAKLEKLELRQLSQIELAFTNGFGYFLSTRCLIQS